MMGPIGCPESPLINDQSTLRKIPTERRYSHLGSSLKSLTDAPSLLRSYNIMASKNAGRILIAHLHSRATYMSCVNDILIILDLHRQFNNTSRCIHSSCILTSGRFKASYKASSPAIAIY
jgi:hypothetical protein